MHGQNLKWKLVPVDGAQAWCVQGDSLVIYIEKEPELGFRRNKNKKKITVCSLISPHVIFIFALLWWRLVDYTASVFLLVCMIMVEHEEAFFFMVKFKSVLSGQIRAHWIRCGATFLSFFVFNFVFFPILSFLSLSICAST